MSFKTILAAKGSDVICIESTAVLAAAEKSLSTHRIGVLVVLDGGGRLVGILSERDIVRAMADGGTLDGRFPEGRAASTSQSDVIAGRAALVRRRPRECRRRLPERSPASGAPKMDDGQGYQSRPRFPARPRSGPV